MTPYFFGYGSLVNRNTHAYPDTRPAKLQGWRRAWIGTDISPHAFLTAVPASGAEIDGLIAAVPGADWAALDARETGYARHSSGGAVVHDILPSPDIAHYAIPPESSRPDEKSILLSYLDVVVQGFARVYGFDGVARFFETTDNWHVPILDDRDAPRYPRHQQLTSEETALVDGYLANLSVLTTG
jgi:hypothetical protein